ncbi:hydroxymethylbilane synthase [Frankia sp. CcI49]|uniref:hydroxymethylbilane synthase n=1 Tax=Frankia sp. R43 TaxID=269536 RepID=UPI0006CA5511|nr:MULTISPECIES: hydroxymethylbilane synthase [unclassified Frankia]KPM53268.1 porphobilinogen deaminase [Frankia sp. R43]ONH59579.1 hydroxymethylbilane synthase [Frankia sp. CcI49]
MTDTREPDARSHARSFAWLTRRPLRLGTRRSALALAQSGHVAEALRARLGCQVELVPIVTDGDRSQGAISQIGGTGVFVSALREALLSGEIDLAVHSLKDLPTATPDGLVLAAVPPRVDTRDVLVSPSGRGLVRLGPNARIGTGAPRRAAQLRAMGLGFDVVPIRGNVDTRIKKAIDGEVDAVILAHAGLERLDRLDAVTEIIPSEVILPAPGQGALAIECLRTAGTAVAPLAGSALTNGALAGGSPTSGGPAGAALAGGGSAGGGLAESGQSYVRSGPDLSQGIDGGLAELLRFVLDDAPSSVAVRAERAFLAGIEAGCTAPVGALGRVLPSTGSSPATGGDGAPAVGDLRLRAVVAAPDGSRVLRCELTGSAVDPEALGQRLADEMLSAGAQTLMGTS